MMSHKRKKIIIIIINTTKSVIIYRVLTTCRHDIKCFMGLRQGEEAWNSGGVEYEFHPLPRLNLSCADATHDLGQ